MIRPTRRRPAGAASATLDLARAAAAGVALAWHQHAGSSEWFLREHYIAEFNGRFRVAPAQRGSAFLPCPRKNLDLIFCLQFERTVNRDNTVSFQNLQLQIEPVQWRGTLAGCSVMVHQHLDGAISLTHGPHRLGRYSAQGVALNANKNEAATAMEKRAVEKSKNRLFPALGNPAQSAGFPLPTATTATGL